jgi:hypothetical protein
VHSIGSTAIIVIAALMAVGVTIPDTSIDDDIEVAASPADSDSILEAISIF